MEILRDAVFAAFAPRNAALDDNTMLFRLIKVWYSAYKAHRFAIEFSLRASFIESSLIHSKVLELLAASRSSPFSVDLLATKADELEGIALYALSVQPPFGSPVSHLLEICRFPKSLLNKNEVLFASLPEEPFKEAFLSHENSLREVNVYFGELKTLLSELPLSGRVRAASVVPSRFSTNIEELLDIASTQKWMIEKALLKDRNLTILSEGLSKGRHGPGAALGISRRDAGLAVKESSTSSITPGLYLYARRDFPFAQLVLTDCPENKLSFVPKNYKSLRIISIEPPLMMFYQLGLGTALRKILKYDFDTDLTDQRRNRLLAREGSISNAIATIDLSRASDSLAFGVMEFFIPPCIFKVLKGCRATAIEGIGHQYEMFSAMGNGLTFPLQSLLFITAVRSIVPKKLWPQCSVYGDDILCPSQYASKVLEYLSFLGFAPNVEKTFVDGPFRESCGGDYHHGLDVTMPRLRGSLHSESVAYAYVNNLAIAYYKTSNQLYTSIIKFVCSTIRRKTFGPFSSDFHFDKDPSSSDRYLAIPFDFVDEDGVVIGWCNKVSSFSFVSHATSSDFRARRKYAHLLRREAFMHINLSMWLRDPGAFPQGVPPDYKLISPRRKVSERAWLWPSRDEILADLRFIP